MAIWRAVMQPSWNSHKNAAESIAATKETSMRIRHTVLIAGASLAFAAPAMAGEDLQHWETLSVTVNLPDDFRISSDTVARTSDARGFYEIEQAVLVGRKLSRKTTVWAGYVFNPTYNHGDFRAREHRFRQQVTFDGVAQVGPFKVGGRIRTEQRWREGQIGTGWRLRPYVKASMPLVGKTSLTLSHESFINLNITTFQTTGGYERMRNSASVTLPLAKGINLDVGYLNQHGFVRGGVDTSDHALTAGLSATF